MADLGIGVEGGDEGHGGRDGGLTPLPDRQAVDESFSGWTKTFTDAGLCVAIVDRLTFGGNIIETGTESYRLAHTKAQQVAAS